MNTLNEFKSIFLNVGGLFLLYSFLNSLGHNHEHPFFIYKSLYHNILKIKKNHKNFSKRKDWQ